MSLFNANSLVPCANCERTFPPELLDRHQKSCTEKSDGISERLERLTIPSNHFKKVSGGKENAASPAASPNGAFLNKLFEAHTQGRAMTPRQPQSNNSVCAEKHGGGTYCSFPEPPPSYAAAMMAKGLKVTFPPGFGPVNKPRPERRASSKVVHNGQILRVPSPDAKFEKQSSGGAAESRARRALTLLIKEELELGASGDEIRSAVDKCIQEFQDASDDSIEYL